MFKYILILSLSLCTQSAFSQRDTAFQLQPGDLIFQDLDCGPMCDAIEAVTQGFEGHAFSHVGLVSRAGSKIMVIEAIGTAVHATPLEDFMKRTPNKMYVGRVKEQYSGLTGEALKFAQQQIGTPYDDAFLYGNGKYYCSELIYDAFMHANHDQPFFRLEPMTFKKPGANTFFPVWLEYYRKLGQSIPEGKLGCNPGGLSRSEKIKIVHVL